MAALAARPEDLDELDRLLAEEARAQHGPSAAAAEVGAFPSQPRSQPGFVSGPLDDAELDNVELEMMREHAEGLAQRLASTERDLTDAVRLFGEREQRLASEFKRLQGLHTRLGEQHQYLTGDHARVSSVAVSQAQEVSRMRMSLDAAMRQLHGPGFRGPYPTSPGGEAASPASPSEFDSATQLAAAHRRVAALELQLAEKDVEVAAERGARETAEGRFAKAASAGGAAAMQRAADLQAEVVALRAESAALADRAKAAEAAGALARAKDAGALSEVKQLLAGVVDALKADIVGLHKALEEVGAEADKWQARAEDAKAEGDAEATRLTAQLALAEAEAARLRGELAAQARAQVEAARAADSAADAAVSQAAAVREQLLAAAAAAAVAAQADVAAARADAMSAHAEAVKAVTARLDALHAEAAAARQETAAVSTQLEASIEATEAVRAEIAGHRRDVEAARTEAAAAAEAMHLARQDATLSKAEAHALKARLTLLSDRAEQLRAAAVPASQTSPAGTASPVGSGAALPAVAEGFRTAQAVVPAAHAHARAPVLARAMSAPAVAHGADDTIYSSVDERGGEEVDPAVSVLTGLHTAAARPESAADGAPQRQLGVAVRSVEHAASAAPLHVAVGAATVAPPIPPRPRRSSIDLLAGSAGGLSAGVPAERTSTSRRSSIDSAFQGLPPLPIASKPSPSVSGGVLAAAAPSAAAGGSSRRGSISTEGGGVSAPTRAPPPPPGLVPSALPASAPSLSSTAKASTGSGPGGDTALEQEGAGKREKKAKRDKAEGGIEDPETGGADDTPAKKEKKERKEKKEGEDKSEKKEKKRLKDFASAIVAANALSAGASASDDSAVAALVGSADDTPSKKEKKEKKERKEKRRDSAEQAEPCAPAEALPATAATAAAPTLHAAAAAGDKRPPSVSAFAGVVAATALHESHMGHDPHHVGGR